MILCYRKLAYIFVSSLMLVACKLQIVAINLLPKTNIEKTDNPTRNSIIFRIENGLPGNIQSRTTVQDPNKLSDNFRVDGSKHSGLENMERLRLTNQQHPPTEIPSPHQREMNVQTFDEKVEAIADILKSGEKILIINIGNGISSGLGSLTNNLLMLQSYFQKIQNRHHLVIVQDKLVHYRKNETYGLYEGLMDTSHIVINTREEWLKLPKDLKSKYNVTIEEDENRSLFENYPTKVTPNMTIYSDPDYDAPVLVIRFFFLVELFRARNAAFDFFGSADSHELYNQMINNLCPTTAFSSETNRMIKSIRQQHHLPSFVESRTADTLEHERPRITAGNTGISVSFHVRRTDKIKEDQYYDAKDYIDTLERVLAEQGVSKSSVEHCFIAADDYEGVCELEYALEVASVPCKVNTLTPFTYEPTRSFEDSYLFLAQMQYLIDATYFIGTFSSNVATLTSLFRACRSHAEYGIPLTLNDTSMIESVSADHGLLRKGHFNIEISESHSQSIIHFDPAYHYYHSYGVDRYDWSLY